jgi:hypothetical protein
MKLNIWIFSLASVVLLSLFATSSGAQNQSGAAPLGRQRAEMTPEELQESASGVGDLEQNATNNSGVSSDVTTTCEYTFTSGGTGADPYLQYCVTVNGNIVEFESPKGIESIREGIIGEGYGVCDVTRGVGYYDWAQSGASSNWNAPTTVSHTATEVKIERTTSDGAWTLTQTITQSAAGGYTRIAMALKNDSSVTKNVYLMRWASINPDNNANGGKSNLDGTISSGWSYIPNSSASVTANKGYGVLLQNVLPLPKGTAGTSGFGLATLGPVNPCNPTADFDGMLNDFDGSVIFLYEIDGIPKNETVTANVKYTAF